MRKQGEILVKVEELSRKRLAERKSKFLSKSPRNCWSNARTRVRGSGKVGFCQSQDVLHLHGTGKFICDDDETSKSCEYFTCRNTEESVEADFEEVLRSPARCGEEYPKLAILIWCLQDGSQGRMTRLGRALKVICASIRDILIFKWW